MDDVERGERGGEGEGEEGIAAALRLPPGVHYLHGLFPEAFIERLEEEMEVTPATTTSNNMYAERRFIRSEEIADDIIRHLPAELGMTHCVIDMKFILYPGGGYIAPHVDGVRLDSVTSLPSTTSFLLYMSTVPEGEGGETEILTKVEGGEVVVSYRPQRGSILIFPHDTPHQGAGVGTFPKVLLRGDMH